LHEQVAHNCAPAVKSIREIQQVLQAEDSAKAEVTDSQRT
jgi:hypothetical protein